MTAERAEAGTRARITAEDRAKYKGVARHPLARRWMISRLAEARENAAAAETEHLVNRWAMEAERVEGELRRLGINVGDGK
jgi:hypothetical protein